MDKEAAHNNHSDYKKEVVDIHSIATVHTHTWTHTAISLGHKKGWKLAICYNINGPTGYYTKWNKSERVRQITHDFPYTWNKWSHSYREQTGSCQRNRGWGSREIGTKREEMKRYKLPVTESWVWNVKCGEYSQQLHNIFVWRQMAPRLIMVTVLKCRDMHVMVLRTRC